MNLTTMRTRVRNAIKDIDASAYYFVDAELDSAITRALNDYCRAAGSTSTVLKSATGATRIFVIDPAVTTDYLYAVAIEYPIDEDPPALRAFQERPACTLRVIGEIPASGTNNIRVWYARLILAADTTWAMPVTEEDVIEIGTAYYLTLAGSRFAATRLNSSQAVPAALAKIAEHLQRDFRRRLAQVQHRSEYPTKFPSWPEA